VGRAGFEVSHGNKVHAPAGVIGQFRQHGYSEQGFLADIRDAVPMDPVRINIPGHALNIDIQIETPGFQVLAASP